MDQATAEVIEKYQIEFEKNPRSKVFAPLADAYRKAGLLNQALAIAKSGVQSNAKFSGGRVVLGKIYDEMGQHDKALQEYKTSAEIDPSNILAHKLLAETYLKQKNIKKALSAFKMVLFLKPNDKTALTRIKKLESLTAEEFDDDSFQIKNINYKDIGHPQEDRRLLERALSLADAFLVRSEFEKSFNILSNARKHFGEDREIIKRLKLIDANVESRAPDEDKIQHNVPNRKSHATHENINYLKSLLSQIHKRKRD